MAWWAGAATGSDVGNPGRLHDRGIVAPVIHDPYEPVIEDREGHTEDFFQGRHYGALYAFGLLGQGGTSRRGKTLEW